MPQASVIIVNYNTAALTLQCIQSFYSFCNNNSFEVIIVDNASNQSDYQTLKNELNPNYPSIKLIRSRINLGFGGGNMLGVQHASMPFYIFVNSDVVFAEDCISPMLQFLVNHNEVSITGCSSVDQDQKPYKAFDYRLSFWSELLSDNALHFLNPKKYPLRKKQYIKPMRVGAVPGSLFAVKACDFDAVGGFDTNLFLYYEEKELSIRIEKKLKKQIFSLPEYHYIHLKGKSTTPSFVIQKELKISQFYTLKKHLPCVAYYIFYILQTLKFILKGIFSNKNRKYALLLLSGIDVSQSLKHQQIIIHD